MFLACLQRRLFHREGYLPHPFSFSCFISSKTAFSTRRLPRLHPFSSSCFISSKTAFSRRRLPAPPLFILLFHIFKDGNFTERVTGSTPFHPLVSYLQKRHFHGEGYRLHPFSSSCFISSKRAFSLRGLPAPPLFIFLFHSFISSKTAFSPRRLPAPPLSILLFHIFKIGVFTERVTGSTPFHPLVSFLQRLHFHREGYRGSTPFHLLVSYLQKQHCRREGYRLHPFSSPCFISSKTAFSPRGENTGSTPFHPLVSYLQNGRFHREGYRLHPFSSSCFISSKTAFSPRRLRAPPLFILLFHIFKIGVFTERVTGSTPFLPLASYLQRLHFHREVTGSTPFHPLVSYLQKRHFH